MVYQITYILRQETKGDFSIYSPDFPISSCGDTKEEALKNFQEAVELYFEEMGKVPAVPCSEFGKLAVNA